MKREAGFSLVELMVGLFVGLQVLLIAMGTASVFESTKRSSTGADSALQNAAMALLAVERDVRMGGLGLVFSGSLNCTAINIFYNNAVKADGSALAPVIIASGAGGPDSVTVRYGTALSGSMPTQAIAGMATFTDPVQLANSNGLAANQLVLVGNPGSTDPCTLMQTTSLQSNAMGTALHHDAGASPWNPSDASPQFTAKPIYPAGSLIVPVGSFAWLTYRVSNGALSLIDNMSGMETPIADNIVFLRAQYGVSDGITQTIDQWVDAANEWASPDAAHIRAIRAIRLGVIARSPKKEKVGADGNCATTTQAPLAWPGGPAVDLSADPDWRCYRYRSLNIVAPLKNVAWGGL